MRKLEKEEVEEIKKMGKRIGGALKMYLKTKKMTDISQTQAGFKAKSRRNPLWIPRLFNAKSGCVCRNRLNFRLFRYTLGLFYLVIAPAVRCGGGAGVYAGAVAGCGNGVLAGALHIHGAVSANYAYCITAGVHNGACVV